MRPNWRKLIVGLFGRPYGGLGEGGISLGPIRGGSIASRHPRPPGTPLGSGRLAPPRPGRPAPPEGQAARHPPLGPAARHPSRF